MGHENINITIQKLYNTSFSIHQVVELMHLSFQERIDQGLNLQGAFVNESDIENSSKEGVVFVAYDELLAPNEIFGLK